MQEGVTDKSRRRGISAACQHIEIVLFMACRARPLTLSCESRSHSDSDSRRLHCLDSQLPKALDCHTLQDLPQGMKLFVFSLVRHARPSRRCTCDGGTSYKL